MDSGLGCCREVRVSVLEFDSRWFGVKVGRYDGDPQEAEEWALANGIDCLYTLVPMEGIGTSVWWATQHGFQVTDVRIEFEAETSPHGVRLREAEGKDWKAIDHIARTSFRRTRFHNDRHLDLDRVNDMYVNWVRTSDATVLVSDGPEGPAGFVSVGATNLELIAVDVAHRGKYHGEKLAEAALNEAYRKGLPTLKVVTQSGNHAAQRTFRSAGFRLVDTSIWLHKWYQ